MKDQSLSARESFAKHLREKRKTKKMSQEELAAKSGLHRTYISAVERGERNISIDNMERLASALGSSLHHFLTKI